VLPNLEGSYIPPADHAAIGYRDLGHRNAVARLQRQLATGQVRLDCDRTAGYDSQGRTGRIIEILVDTPARDRQDSRREVLCLQVPEFRHVPRL
jgi:hypothetical protein